MHTYRDLLLWKVRDLGAGFTAHGEVGSCNSFPTPFPHLQLAASESGQVRCHITARIGFLYITSVRCHHVNDLFLLFTRCLRDTWGRSGGGGGEEEGYFWEQDDLPLPRAVRR